VLAATLNLDAVRSAAAPATVLPSADQQSATLDYNAFLNLLVAQLKNQDPTKPLDPGQFMAQLASFSNVEQAIKMNNKLDGLMTSMALAQAEGVIGRTVVSEDGTIQGKVTALRIVSGGAVAVLEGGRELLLGPGVTVS
jgi:flagellar basal-body rod modification protein FlgD